MRKNPASIPWFTLALLAAGAWSLFERIHSATLLNFYQDDAFYYFQIARNIASHHGSTFDGVHLTNGYHPLWMLTLVALNLISSGRTFFFLMQCVALLSFIATFLAARALFRCFSTNLFLTQIAASIVALQCLFLVRSAMEITLTLPLALTLCWYRLRPQFKWTNRTATLYGLLAALVVLSRLDSVIFIAVLFALELLFARDDRQYHFQTWLITAIPVTLYAFSNQHWFGIWSPISGQAKQLRLHHTISLATLKISLAPINFPYQLLIVYPALIIIFICIALSVGKNKPPLRRIDLAIALGLLLLPLLQFTAFFTTSDWPIWPWYLYSLPLAMTGSFILFFDRHPAPEAFIRRGTGLALQTAILLLAFFFAAATASGETKTRWYLFALDIQNFAQTHTGIYAMGDCAGTTAYVINQPLIQLEGLVMDAPFLDNIRQQRNLNDVLKSYNVRYYVTANATLTNGCYIVKEPIQAGPDSPHMQGTFCQAPIATYVHGTSTLNVFDLNP